MIAQDFHLTSDNLSLVKPIEIDGLKIQAVITTEKEGLQTIKNINWKTVDEILYFVKNNMQDHLFKATKFLQFLTENSGLYSPDEVQKISEFQVTSLKIVEPFGQSINVNTATYTLQFDFVSDYWIDTYGLLEVVFLRGNVVAVQRSQT